MIEVQKTWTNLKTTIDGSSVYYYCADDDFTGYRKVIVVINFSLIEWAKIQLIDVEDPLYGTGKYVDQKDFDDNYADRAGEKDFLGNGWEFTATKNTSTSYTFQLTDFADSPIEAFLFKGQVLVESTAVFGDSFKIEATDEDGIVYPAGTVLSTMYKKRYIGSGEQDILVKPSDIDSVRNKKKIPSWAYIKMTFISVGTEYDIKIKLGADYEF